jgi:predicted dehydrogenase
VCAVLAAALRLKHHREDCRALATAYPSITMASGIRVGVIGTGFAAASHVDALRRVPSVEIVAIAGSSAPKAEAAGERLGISNTFGDYRQLLRGDTVHVVHDCTPNYLHSAINTEALRAGKHLLSEKPLAMDSSQTASLVHEAAHAGVVAGVCFNYRHYPLVRQAKVMLAAGEFGPPHLVHGGYLQDWLLFPTDWNWRLDPGQGGVSRAVADIGSHWMDLVQYVTGHRIQEVLAVMDTVHSERRRPIQEVATFGRTAQHALEPVAVTTEDAATAIFRTDRRLRGTFTVSQVSAGHKNRLFFEIDAGEGSVRWDQEDPNFLRIGRRDAANSELPRDPSMLVPEAAALTHFPGGHQEGWPDAMKNLFLDFYNAVGAHDAGSSYEGSFATFEDAHRITQVVEAIVRSHKSERWETVGVDRSSEEVTV